MNRILRHCLFAGMVLLILGGCEMKNYVGPKEIPVWLVIRQINGIEKDYAFEREEALEAVKYAITSQGGIVRYFTEVGSSRTLYGRTAEGEGIIVDIDPYYNKKPGLIEIDVSVTMYGDKKKARKLLAGIDEYVAQKASAGVVSAPVVAQPPQNVPANVVAKADKVEPEQSVQR